MKPASVLTRNKEIIPASFGLFLRKKPSEAGQPKRLTSGEESGWREESFVPQERDAKGVQEGEDPFRTRKEPILSLPSLVQHRGIDMGLARVSHQADSPAVMLSPGGCCHGARIARHPVKAGGRGQVARSGGLQAFRRPDSLRP